MTRAIGSAPQENGTRAARRAGSPAVTAAKVAGVVAMGLVPLLLNPFVIGSVVAVATLVVRPGGRVFSARRG